MKLEANGITIGYETQGTGKAVTFIHALGVERSMWWKQIPAFAAYRTIAYDVRGHGESSSPAGPYSFDLFADDLRGLLGALGVARSHLVGVSMGGMIAQTVAIKYPELVSSVVLVDTTSEWEGEERRQFFEERAAIAEREGLTNLIESSLERYFTEPYRRQHPDLVDHFRQILLRNNLRGYAAATRAVSVVNTTADLHRISCPALVVVGDEDPITVPAMSEDIARRIPGARLAVMPRAAHLTPVQTPEEFNRAVLGFLAEVERP